MQGDQKQQKREQTNDSQNSQQDGSAAADQTQPASSQQGSAGDRNGKANTGQRQPLPATDERMNYQ